MIIQKVNTCGTSRAVIIPKGFFDYWEAKGKTFHEILLNISDEMDQITIKPIFEEGSLKK